MAAQLRKFFDSTLFHQRDGTRASIVEFAEKKYSWTNIGRPNIRSLHRSGETSVKRLFSQYSFALSADLVRRVLGFISVAYLARILGKADFGAVNLGFAVLAYGMVLSAAGFPMIGTKKIAQGAPLEIVGQVIGSRLISTILVLAMILLR